MVLDILGSSIINRKMTFLRVYNKKVIECIYRKYSELVHMAEMHSQARASSPYELVPNILRYAVHSITYLYKTPLQSVKAGHGCRNRIFGQMKNN